MSEAAGGVRGRTAGAGYRRDRLTWAVFAALLSFGFLNAVLGPALPYLRAVEHVGYVVGRCSRWRSRSAVGSPGSSPPVPGITRAAL